MSSASDSAQLTGVDRAGSAPSGAPSAPLTRSWKFSLCSCCEVGCCPACLLLCCSGGVMFPCTIAGIRTAVNPTGVNSGTCCLACLFPLCCGAIARGEVRRKFNIAGSGCADCLAVWFCGGCAVIQMLRELGDEGYSVRDG